MPQTLFLIRHGPTHARGLVGWTDLPADLSDHAALARLSDALPQDATVVSSDLTRAIATADAVSGPRPRLPHDAGLREMHFGEWEMLNPRELPPDDRARLAAFWEAPDMVRPPGGEGWTEFTARGWAAIDAHLGAVDTPLVVVAHFGLIIAAMQRAEALDPADAMAMRVDNLSLTEITVDGNDWRAVSFNQRP